MTFIEGELLRIFVGEQAKLHHRPFYEIVINEALKHGLSGATVIKGVLSFGHSHRVHAAKIFELSQDMPIVIEIVDSPDRIETFLPALESMIKELGEQPLVTREQIRLWGNRQE
jgi:PII-like signaling protein